jgi:hypothetical protein
MKAKHTLFSLLMLNFSMAYVFDIKSLLLKYRENKTGGCPDSACIKDQFKIIYEADFHNPHVSDSLSLDFLRFSETKNTYAKGKARLIRGVVLSFRGEHFQAIDYLLNALKLLG